MHLSSYIYKEGNSWKPTKAIIGFLLKVHRAWNEGTSKIRDNRNPTKWIIGCLIRKGEFKKIYGERFIINQSELKCLENKQSKERRLIGRTTKWDVTNQHQAIATDFLDRRWRYTRSRLRNDESRSICTKLEAWISQISSSESSTS